MQNKPEISIVIPLYNEVYNIEPLYKEIIKSLNSIIIFEIIYVDDGSDDTSHLILDNLRKEKFVKVIKHNKNLGQSFSLLSGIKEAKYETIVTLDGDGQNIPGDIIKLIEVYFASQNLCLVGGIREYRKDSNLKIISSKIANFVRSSILQDKCPDTGCGLKVFNKEKFLSLPFFDGIHRFLPALFRGFSYNISFVQVGHRPRIHGISKYGTLKRLFIGIIDIIRVLKIIKSANKKL